MSALVEMKLTSVAIDEKSITMLNSGPQEISYQDVINYPRSSVKGQHTCVMCGKMDSKECVIPGQNKDVCKVCDSLVWLAESQGAEFKFCKGCKNFVCIYEFCDKPKASKCGKCRNRCRSSYSARRSSSGSASSDSYEHEFARYQISDSPRGVVDMMMAQDAGDFQFEKGRTPPTAMGDCTHRASMSSGKRLPDTAQYYAFDRDREAGSYMSPSLYGSGMVSPMEKENRANYSVSASKRSRPRIGAVIGDGPSEEAEHSSKAARGTSTPGLLLPRIPNSLLNIHSASKRPAADAQTPASGNPAGKNVLDDLLLLNASLRKSPLTFISGMPSPEVPGEYAGLGSEDFSPSQHHRMFLEHRMGVQTPRQPSTPSADGAARSSFLPTPGSARSWDSQEGGAWYHDVLVAMSKDQSVKKSTGVVRSHSMDEAYDQPVAKRIKYGDMPSPAVAKAKADLSPPTTPWGPANGAVAKRGASTCPAPSVATEGCCSIERSASCSKAAAPKGGKWEWDPTANPLMHLAMVLSKNENSEEEIFRDLSSDSSSAEGDDSDSVRSLAGSPSEVPRASVSEGISAI